MVAVRQVSLAALEAPEWHASKSVVMFLLWMLVSKELALVLLYDAGGDRGTETDPSESRLEI